MKKLKGNVVVEATLVFDVMILVVLVGYVLMCTEVIKGIEVDKSMINVGYGMAENDVGRVVFYDQDDMFYSYETKAKSFGISYERLQYGSAFPKLVDEEYSIDNTKVFMVMLNPMQRKINRFNYKRWFGCDDSELDEIDRKYGVFVY